MDMLRGWGGRGRCSSFTDMLRGRGGSSCGRGWEEEGGVWLVPRPDSRGRSGRSGPPGRAHPPDEATTGDEVVTRAPEVDGESTDSSETLDEDEPAELRNDFIAMRLLKSISVTRKETQTLKCISLNNATSWC